MELSVLQQSEFKFRSLFEAMFEAFFLCEVVYDENGQPYDYIYVEVNDAAVKLTGFSRDQMVGNTLRTVLPKVSEVWLNYYARAARGENLEFEEYSPAFKKYFKTIMYAPFPGYVAILTIDITGRKRTEEALRLSEERLRYSLEASDEGYWEWNEATNSGYFSPRYYTMLGYEPNEFEPSYENWVNLIHPDQRDWLPQKSMDLCIIKDNITTECQLRTKSGDYKWILSRWKVFTRNNAGIPTRIIGTHTDVTERKRIEEVLTLNEQRISLILDSVPVAFYEIDMSEGFNIQWLSNSMEKLTGFTHADFISEQHFWRNRIHKDDLEKLIDISDFPADLYQLEHRWKCADNKYKWFMYRANLIRDDEGRPLKIIGLMQDVSAQKLYEKKLRESERQARALSRHIESIREEERKNLAREVHDELGQSLTVLKLMANSIKKNLVNGSAVHASELDGMTRLISSTIKSVQRITTELRPDILDTVGLIAAIEWQAESFSHHNSIKCSLALGDFKSCDFQSDISTVIFRTVQEALTNVSRHAEASEVRISLKKQSSSLILSVEDNGIGISSKQLNAMKSFGLKGMQERAVFAGGKLIVKGEKGKGTVVKLKIPLERAFNKCNL